MHGQSQRMANVLTAFAWSKRSCPSAWMSDDLNAILVHGDATYSDIRSQSSKSYPYLSASELPTRFSLDSVEFSVTQDNPRSGQLLQSSGTSDSSVEDISSEFMFMTHDDFMINVFLYRGGWHSYTIYGCTLVPPGEYYFPPNAAAMRSYVKLL